MTDFVITVAVYLSALLSISTAWFKSSLMSLSALLVGKVEFSSLSTISSLCGSRTSIVICDWFASVAA